MKKQKSKRSKSRDRLSELPDSLIFFIFELLPMNDVVKTTILSKRWKDLWKTVPFLNFTDSSFRYDPNISSARNFVNRALILWEGIKMLKFTIDFRSRYGHYKSLLTDDLNVWVRWAKQKEVEEIHLRIKDDYEPYQLSECLYSCSSLKVLVLSLNEISLWSIPGNIKWDSLKSLTIDSLYFDFNPEFIIQALRGSPNLEVFNLTLHELESQVGSVFIQSSSLKKLSIRKPRYETDKELKIVTPNLETLEISGSPYRRCVLSDSSSLTDVTLRFQEDKSWYDSIEHENLSAASCEHDCGKTLNQILPTIRHVERLKLSSWCIQVLQRTNKQHLLSRPYFKVRNRLKFAGRRVWCFDK
ncbi:F-box/FBD/LRR-repeat protein At5g56420-like [Salvia miltiorrhiza]|uniref:F-box/FBD/LRR-repeat protein At5g56420-like n=1 Tax=Salvia miltiorrhiza TaxID=226208 RepID=UPI0025AC40CF|nr:F-box/FBD/LRR-repeat protein At5g56420-like [Salvia miltiorrhiza]